MLGVFLGDRRSGLISWLTVVLLAVVGAIVVCHEGSTTVFSGAFIDDAFARFNKILALGASALSIVVARDFVTREGMDRFEFPIQIALSTLGMMMLSSANDLIAFYLGLELMSLALYVVAAFQRDSIRSTEAGLKYFVLGALSSGLILYGASLIYGFSGTTSFPALADLLARTETPLGLLFGLVFLTAGFAFKVSVVPFHMWTPDVYEGAPTPVTSFFAIAPKVAGMAIFVRTLVLPFAHMTDQWQQIVVFLAIASMLLGAFAAIGQRNIKRMMAYSAIGHMGYALVGLAAGTKEGVQGVLIYIAIYIVMTLGAFICILAMRRKHMMVEDIGDLSGLARTQPGLALACLIFMFSLAGIPPLAGFFAKFYVFLPAMHAHLYTLVIIGVLTSVVAAFYYLRIVWLMYFDEPAEPFEQPLPGPMRVVLAATALATVLFVFAPGWLLGPAGVAAAALFPG
jgi:NADH-quinone oxidoreductase subunit N